MTTRWLERPGGRVAYDVRGTGPLTVCVPGMGDLRDTFRHVVPLLVEAGHRVATMDLRGHGESDSSFPSYDLEDTVGDVRALVEQLGGPAVVVGSSMGAGAAARLAAESPELVTGLVLSGPFLRETAPAWKKALLRIAMAPPWAAAAWRAFLPSLYAGQTPVDHDEYLRQVRDSLARPGHAQAFARTTRVSHAETQAGLGDVRAPCLVVMGRLDPDFPDPAAEARWAAEALRGELLLVDEAGHYPLAQRPDVVAPAVLTFLGGLGEAGGGAARPDVPSA